jgi:hypothetical protein
VEQAKAFARDKDVSVRPGNIGGQALVADLVEEVRVDLVPVVFGAGARFFGDYARSPLLLDNPQVVQATGSPTCTTACATTDADGAR